MGDMRGYVWRIGIVLSDSERLGWALGAIVLLASAPEFFFGGEAETNKQIKRTKAPVRAFGQW